MTYHIPFYCAHYNDFSLSAGLICKNATIKNIRKNDRTFNLK